MAPSGGQHHFLLGLHWPASLLATRRTGTRICGFACLAPPSRWADLPLPLWLPSTPLGGRVTAACLPPRSAWRCCGPATATPLLGFCRSRGPFASVPWRRGLRNPSTMPQASCHFRSPALTLPRLTHPLPPSAPALALGPSAGPVLCVVRRVSATACFRVLHVATALLTLPASRRVLSSGRCHHLTPSPLWRPSRRPVQAMPSSTALSRHLRPRPRALLQLVLSLTPRGRRIVPALLYLRFFVWLALLFGALFFLFWPGFVLAALSGRPPRFHV